MDNIVLLNMVMIYDKENDRLLVQERTGSWPGIAFPGGHLEYNESLIDSAIREVKEETGLDVKNLKPCGLIHWFHTKTHYRELIFYYKTEAFSGALIEKTHEGRVFWVAKSEIMKLPLAESFDEQINLFFKDEYNEIYIEYDDNTRQPFRWL